ncbi:MAG: hypothetical protein AAF525_02300 [Pseudomonadota bacterium]
MHIVIAVITAIAGLLWALNSLQQSGFDLNSLNPFYWWRRRAWEKKQVDPLYAIESPRELAAVLAFATVRLGGDPTEEQKQFLLKAYEEELLFTAKDGTEMYAVASHLVSTDPNFEHQATKLVAPCKSSLTEEQRTSILKLATEAAACSGTLTDAQTDFINALSKALYEQR